MDEQTESQSGSTAELETPAASDAPEAVRQSPEYQAALRQNRTLARQLGTARRQAEEARRAAEETRLAAEAEREAALAAQVREVLGDEGIAEYAQLADLSATDPLAGAQAFRELLNRAAQSGQATQPPPAPQVQQAATANASQEAAVPENEVPPPPETGVDASAPLGSMSSGEDLDALVEDLTGDFTKVAEQNRQPLLRSRLREADRRDALMKYLGASYLKAGAKASAKTR